MDQGLVKLLEQTGFTAKEAEVYLAMLKITRGTVAEIAKLTELKRPIIYVILEGLIKRGHASEVPGLKVNTFQVTDPSVILTNLKKTTREFSEILPYLQTMHNMGGVRPQINYYESKEGIMNVWNKTPHAKEQFFISSYLRIEEIFPGIVDRWTEPRIKGTLPKSGRHLIPNMEAEILLAMKFKDYCQEVRVSDELVGINMDFTIFDNTLAITSFEQNPFIVAIESSDLVSSIKPMFEMAWERGKSIYDL